MLISKIYRTYTKKQHKQAINHVHVNPSSIRAKKITLYSHLLKHKKKRSQRATIPRYSLYNTIRNPKSSPKNRSPLYVYTHTVPDSAQLAYTLTMAYYIRITLRQINLAILSTSANERSIKRERERPVVPMPIHDARARRGINWPLGRPPIIARSSSSFCSTSSSDRPTSRKWTIRTARLLLYIPTALMLDALLYIYCMMWYASRMNKQRVWLVGRRMQRFFFFLGACDDNNFKKEHQRNKSFGYQAPLSLRALF